MKYLILRILCIGVFFFAQNLHGGTADISDLLKRLNEIKAIDDPIARDTQLIWQYNFISEELGRYLDPRAEDYLDTLRMMTDLSDWDNGDGFYYRAVGRYHDFRGNFEEALSYYERAIEAFIPAGGDLKELAFTFVLKGFLLSNSGMQDECWETLERGLPYARQTNYKNSLCLMLDWFGDYYYYGLNDTVNNQLALDYYLQVNEILPQISYSRIIADNHAVLSGVYQRLDQHELSDYHFKIADSISAVQNLPHVRWGLYAEKARLLEENGDFLGANKIYRQTEEFMKASSLIEFKSRLEQALWQNYKQLGNFEKALFHYENMVEMENQMSTDDVLKKYEEIEAKYNVAIKEKEVEDLKQSKLKSNRNLMAALLALSLLAGVVVYRKNLQIRRSLSDLEKSRNEAEQAIYTGESQERKRLSGELHDNVSTKLVAARWQLESIAPELDSDQRKVIETSVQMLNGAYQDVRNIAHNLVPDQLETIGLVGVIKNLLQKLNSTGNVQFGFTSDPVDHLDMKVVLYPLYNIIFELINNVIKHANATKADIEIKSSEDFLNIIVKDNGKGFNVNAIQDGFGLKSISSRTKSLNGKLNIQSDPESGTTTSITIPINGVS